MRADVRYVQVNVGRGDMSAEDWAAFISDTGTALAQSVLSDFPTGGIETHTGIGGWNGTPEESAHVSIFANVDYFALRVALAELRDKYNQDAIALIQRSELI